MKQTISAALMISSLLLMSCTKAENKSQDSGINQAKETLESNKTNAERQACLLTRDDSAKVKYFVVVHHGSDFGKADLLLPRPDRHLAYAWGEPASETIYSKDMQLFTCAQKPTSDDLKFFLTKSERVRFELASRDIQLVSGTTCRQETLWLGFGQSGAFGTVVFHDQTDNVDSIKAEDFRLTYQPGNLSLKQTLPKLKMAFKSTKSLIWRESIEAECPTWSSKYQQENGTSE